MRFAPGGGAAFAAALAAALGAPGDGDSPGVESLARAAGAEPDAVRELASLLLEDGGPDGTGAEAGDHAGGEGAREIVVLWGERLTAGPNGAAGARALIGLADALGMGEVEGAGLLEIPAFANGRGLREAGVLPGVGPGLTESPAPGGGQTSAGSSAQSDPRDARGIAEGLAAGELSALYLLHCDPLRDLPDTELWERALAGATSVIAHASFLTEGVREHANVVFPAETYAEKEGTIVHPDGRLQRLRPAIARAGGSGSMRAEWQVIAELALRLGLDLDVLSGAMASQRLLASVPFYAGLTLEEIAGRGVRWQERDAAAAFPSATLERGARDGGELAPIPPNAAELAGHRSIWDAPEVEFSPALEFLYPRAHAVLPLTYVGGEPA